MRKDLHGSRLITYIASPDVAVHLGSAEPRDSPALVSLERYSSAARLVRWFTKKNDNNFFFLKFFSLFGRDIYYYYYFFFPRRLPLFIVKEYGRAGLSRGRSCGMSRSSAESATEHRGRSPCSFPLKSPRPDPLCGRTAFVRGAARRYSSGISFVGRSRRAFVGFFFSSHSRTRATATLSVNSQ